MNQEGNTVVVLYAGVGKLLHLSILSALARYVARNE